MKLRIASAIKSITQLLIILLFTLSAGAVSAATKFEVIEALSFSGKMTGNNPVDVGLEVRGVKLESVYFGDKMEALFIFWNRSPATVRPEVGIALFDKSGKLLATGSDQSGSLRRMTVRSGKQMNYKLHFDKFIDDYSKVASFQLVFSIVGLWY
jgi:hypothetical protein